MDTRPHKLLQEDLEAAKEATSLPESEEALKIGEGRGEARTREGEMKMAGVGKGVAEL